MVLSTFQWHPEFGSGTMTDSEDDASVVLRQVGATLASSSSSSPPRPSPPALLGEDGADDVIRQVGACVRRGKLVAGTPMAKAHAGAMRAAKQARAVERRHVVSAAVQELQRQTCVSLHVIQNVACPLEFCLVVLYVLGHEKHLRQRKIKRYRKRSPRTSTRVITRHGNNKENLETESEKEKNRRRNMKQVNTEGKTPDISHTSPTRFTSGNLIGIVSRRFSTFWDICLWSHAGRTGPKSSAVSGGSRT